MAATLNRVTLVGFLTADPEARAKGDLDITSFRLTFYTREKEDGEWVDRPSWIAVTAFGRTAAACNEHLAKKDRVGIDGHLRQDRWETDQGGKRSEVKLIAQDVFFLSERQREPAAAAGAEDRW